MKVVAWWRLTVPVIFMGWLCVMSTVPGMAGEHPLFYLRAGAGLAFSGDAVFADVDCHSSSPAALFGCIEGNDGRPIGAYGDFGNSPVLDLAVGYQWNSWFATEILFAFRSDLPFSGESNFIQLDPVIPQAVSADLCSSSAMVVGVVRPLALLGRETSFLEPVVLAGAGIVRNKLDPMVFVFPDTETITPEGRYTGFAWMMGAGMARRISQQLTLAFSWRYVDLGQVETDIGTMTILDRSSGDVITDSIIIGGTTADLTVNEIAISLIWQF